jgi:hypothetical protein
MKLSVNIFNKSNQSSMMLKAFLIGTFSFVSIYAYAQQKGDEIPDVKVNIESVKIITLPPANRNFDKIPPRASDPIKPPMTYSFQSFNFNAPLINAQIRPLKLKAQSSDDIYGNYVRVGYGNYASPLLEAYLNSRKDKNKLMGAHFYHYSSGKGPVDGKNSSSGTTGIELSARSVGEDVSLGATTSFENRATTFYGYPEFADVDKKDIKQSYSQFKLKGELANAKSSDISYKLGAAFNYLSDKYKARETEIDLTLNSFYKLDEASRINLDVSFFGISRKDALVEAKPRSLFVINPSYAFEPMEDLKLSLGANVSAENDSIDTKNLHVYPDFKASYTISPSVDLVAHLTGGMEKVSLQTLSNENLWLAPNIPIFHTNKSFDFGFGMNAKVGNKVGAYAGVSFANLKNWYFFINDPTDQSKFTVTYDDARRTNLYAALSYAQSETAKFLVRGDLYGYNTQNLNTALHRPTYKLTMNGSFNLYQKLIFSADLIAQGGMKALKQTDAQESQTVNLKAAVDLNFKTEYIFSKSFSAFLQFNNILSNKYPVFLNYPVRGFQFMGGITWSF